MSKKGKQSFYNLTERKTEIILKCFQVNITIQLIEKSGKNDVVA